MKVYSNQTDFYIDPYTAVSIGKFDGEHTGHQKLLGVLSEEAKKRDLSTAVFTFNISPADIVEAPDKQTGVIMTNHERADRLAKAGIEYLVEYPFTPEVASMPAEDFISNVLVDRMHMKLIVAGPDCSFGYKKRGNADLLKKLSSIYNYEVIIIEKKVDTLNREISSTLIKSELDQGHIEQANDLLGSVYCISGTVVSGNHLGGNTLGFPTVNILPETWKHLPRYGVYATKVYVEDGERMISYYGLTNVGINPTISNDKERHKARIETNLYNCKEDLYGSYITVSFYKFIRDEHKFGSMDELKKQISKDQKDVAEYFSIQLT